MNTYERRQEAAQRLGWRSYGQRRYWEARWSDETARRLARRCCGGREEPGRENSVIPCRECNDRVHPKGTSFGDVDWRARLVAAAQA